MNLFPCQILGMGGTLLMFSFLHLISPMRRGSIMTFAVVWFVCLGAPAGYSAARLYKMMGGEYWKATTLGTARLLFVLY
jgi:transmembrane 9 superfamily protein 2/4